MEGESSQVRFGNLTEALAQPDTGLRLFGKPEVSGQRRMGVVLARGQSIAEACDKAIAAAGAVTIQL